MHTCHLDPLLSLVTNALAIVHLSAQAVREWRKESARPAVDGDDQMIDVRKLPFESGATMSVADFAGAPSDASGSASSDREGGGNGRAWRLEKSTAAGAVDNRADSRAESELEMTGLGPTP